MMETDYELSVRRRYEKLTRTLIRRGLSITTMESCPSGQIASLITDTEGASAILKGAYITYSNEAKIMAGVSADTIEKYGVYSVETAQAMAAACKKAFRADIGIGVTGTMGNMDPANPEGIPGEIFFAVAADDGISCKRMELSPQPTRLRYKLVAADAVAGEVERRLAEGEAAADIWKEG